ncbi:MAG: peroxidase-related enzyme [Sphingomicrobium sp.]
MTLIATVSPEEAQEPLLSMYARIAGPGGAVDNILLAHGLRPHTLEGHMGLYKAVLHHRGNTLPKYFLESIGVLVSAINRCTYCVEHHLAGLKRLLDQEPERFAAIAAVLARSGEAFAEIAPALGDVFDQSQIAALDYASKLTRNPSTIGAESIAALRDAGFSDGEILEINQVAAYFAYANRTVLGLGCAIDGEALGLSPGNGDDPENWSHM